MLTQKIQSKKKLILDTPVKIYDLAVAKNKNYIVGNLNLISHNCSAYHHGSLEGTIINMAQSFTGSNNVPYLDDIGQFGSRISPAASASRYIFTRISESFRRIFLREDDEILKYLEDDGMAIEPEFYLPIIPTILLNGSDGMGTGFACHILSYNPLHLISACEEVIKKGSLSNDLIPWYRGYTGNIEKIGAQTAFTGCYSIENTTTIKITELPIGSYTQKYRDHLNDLEDKGIIKTYVDRSTEERTEFVVTCPRDTLRRPHDDLLKTFKLISRDTENFTVWNYEGKLQKFSSAKDIIQWFVHYRLGRYTDRKNHMLSKLELNLKAMLEKHRFIQIYLKDSNWFSSNNKDAIWKRLESEGFDLDSIDDLLSIRIYNLTQDQLSKLESDIKETKNKIDQIQTTSIKDMYLSDLHSLKTFFKQQKKFA